jgi:hypothetical protein
LAQKQERAKDGAPNLPAIIENALMKRIVVAARGWFGDPVFLLGLAAALIAFAVQSGELGSADADHRLQTAHSWWTSEPPVFPNEYPDFGVRGRGGKVQAFFGLGQSLLMLPADIAGTCLERLPVFADYNGNDPTVRHIFVSYTTNILLSVLTALVCYRFLRRLKFSEGQAVAGVLALLVATTHLHYTQITQENNYIFLLTLAGLSYQYEWLMTGSRRALLIGSAAFGLNLLTRLTTGMDLIAGGIFILLTLWFEGERGRALWVRCRDYLFVAGPVYLLFGFLDRLYQFYRFGSFFNTYMSLTAAESRQRDPSLPLNFPFTTPFHEGFLGALFGPAKSVFLFDPLLIVTVLVVVFAWRRLTPAMRAYTLAAWVLLFVYMAFYARYFVWAGDFAWGDRYVSSAAELAALLAVPLLLRYRVPLGNVVWSAGVALVVISAAIQVASVAFWLSLEEFQMETLGRSIFVVGLRFKNIIEFARGRTDPFGLANRLPNEDLWAYEHITSWNFLPFQLQHAGQAPGWVVELAFALWCAALLGLVWTLWRLRGVLAAKG